MKSVAVVVVGLMLMAVMFSGCTAKTLIASLSADPSWGYAPLEVTFTMGATNSNGTVVSWTLDVDNDGTAEYSGNGTPPATQSHTYTTVDTYTAKLTVVGSDRTSDYAVETISVNKPIAKPDISVYVRNNANVELHIFVKVDNVTVGNVYLTAGSFDSPYTTGYAQGVPHRVEIEADYGYTVYAHAYTDNVVNTVWMTIHQDGTITADKS